MGFTHWATKDSGDWTAACGQAGQRIDTLELVTCPECLALIQARKLGAAYRANFDAASQGLSIDEHLAQMAAFDKWAYQHPGFKATAWAAWQEGSRQQRAKAMKDDSHV